MFGKFISLHFRQGKKNLFLNLPDFLSAKSKEEFSVFDRNGYTPVQEVFSDDECNTRWLQITLANDSAILVDEDQEFIVGPEKDEILVRAGDISPDMYLPFCVEKFPNPKAVITQVPVLIVQEVPPREGYELMTKSRSYIVGGFLLASI